MFGFVSLGVSFASLVISCAALYWSRMARIEAAGAVERSRYALESSRKHVGLPYDHKIVHDWELRTQFGFAPQIKDDWTRRKDSDGVADSDDAFEVFSDGTYRIVPNSGVFSVLKPVFCREHGTCDDPACPYAICAGVQRVRTSLVLCPRSGIAYIDTGGDGLEMIPNALQALASSDRSTGPGAGVCRLRAWRRAARLRPSISSRARMSTATP